MTQTTPYGGHAVCVSEVDHVRVCMFVCLCFFKAALISGQQKSK